MMQINPMIDKDARIALLNADEIARMEDKGSRDNMMYLGKTFSRLPNPSTILAKNSSNAKFVADSSSSLNRNNSRPNSNSRGHNTSNLMKDTEAEKLKQKIEEQNRQLAFIESEKFELLKRLNDANENMAMYTKLNDKQERIVASTISTELETSRILLQRAKEEADEWKARYDSIQKNMLFSSTENNDSISVIDLRKPKYATYRNSYHEPLLTRDIGSSGDGSRSVPVFEGEGMETDDSWWFKVFRCCTS